METNDQPDYGVAGELTEAFASHDLSLICTALMEAVRERGVRVVAEQTGISRTAIHAALVRHRNPQLSTLLALIRAVELQVFLYPLQTHPPNGPGDLAGLRESAR